jgi:hypothetical protein
MTSLRFWDLKFFRDKKKKPRKKKKRKEKEKKRTARSIALKQVWEQHTHTRDLSLFLFC